MFFRTVVLTATLTAAVMPADAHAGSVPAGSQFIETIHRANRAISITLEYDTLRTEIGFARAGDNLTFVEGPMDGTLFGDSRLAEDDDGLRLVATAGNEPAFGDFVAALTQPSGRHINSRFTMLRDPLDDRFLANYGEPLPASTPSIDWSDWQIDAVELVIKGIRFEHSTLNNDRIGTAVYIDHEVNVFGRTAAHAVPTPTAAAAGLGLMGLIAGRRWKQANE